MAIYRGPGGSGDSTANASGDAAVASTAAANAAASAAAAASSATSAGVDAGTAQNAANNAANSETAAATSAGNAATSASAASASASSATTSATAAALSESNTATLYDNFDDRYLGVKTTSPATDNDGNTLQTGALYFNSTTNEMYVWTGSLWTTVSNTTTSTNAATSAAAALASQNAAATSASNAATSATNASNSASTASTQASNAASSASAASTSASNASSSASSASSSASTATTQASNASTSATNAASSASAASTSASNASTSASNAATSESNAATSASNAAASYDSFDDRYLGAKSSDPTLDNDGNALLTGALYFNTVSNKLKAYTGSAWVFQANAGANSDITSLSGLTTALSIAQGGTNATTAAGARTSILPSYTGNGGKVLAVNALATDVEYVTVAGVGTVTSVAATVPTGFSISGSPIVTNGTLGITYTAGYSLPTTSSQTNWDTAYTDRLKWDGGATGLTAATGRTSLGATTVGANLFTLSNPTAITFPRFNADNTVSALSDSDFRTAIGAGTSSTTGTVTSASVVSANGFTGTVATATTTPAITLTTSITGVLKGNGTAISAATSGTDYLVPPSGTSILKANSGGALANATSGTDYSAGTSSLATGIIKSTTTTGALSIAVAADFPTLNQNTTGSSATLTTPRAIYGNNFDGSAALTQVIAGTYGGTGVNNGSNTFTIAGNINHAGAFTQTFTATANTSVTLPTTGTLSTLAGTETFTNKTLTSPTLTTATTSGKFSFGGAIDETVYAVIDAAGVALSPSNGTIQTWTLGASRTPTAGTWDAGESLTLMINDGTAYTVTWTTLAVTWVGGSAPTLATTGFTVIELWKVNSTIYGALVGDVA